jgi:hypothetical protein
MGQFKLFIQYLAKVYLPGFFLLILIFAAPFFLKFNNTSEKELHFAYYSEIEAYKWTKRINKIDGLILGSSTLRYGLSCDLLQSDQYRQWVNLSMDARDPVVFYLLLNRYLKELKPKIVLLGLDPWIYSKSYYRYRNPVMLNDLNFSQKLKYYSHVDQKLPIRILKYRYFTRNDGSPIKNVKVPDDFGSVKLNSQAINFNEVNQDFFQLADYGWSQVQFDYLKKIDSLCALKKVKVIYIISPKRKDYVSTCIEKFNLEHNRWWTLINETIPNAEIIGTYGALKNYDQNKIFADAYHLNGFGQNIFSEYVKDNISKSKRVNLNYNFIE